MSDMQINTGDDLRVYYHGRVNFFNVTTKDDWFTTIWNLDNFNYWLVVRFTDGRYGPHQIVCVPDKEWFIDWAVHPDNKGKFEIVYDPISEIKEATDPVDDTTQPSENSTPARASKKINEL